VQVAEQLEAHNAGEPGIRNDAYITSIPFSTTFFHNELISFHITSICIKDQAQTIHQVNFVGIIFFFNRIYYTARVMLCHKRHNTLSNLTGR